MDYKLRKIAKNIWLFFLDLIFPIECLGCGQEEKWLCRSCLAKIKLKVKQECSFCNTANDFGQTCPTCSAGRYLNGVLVAASYDDEIIVKLIKSFKYYFIKDLAQDLGKIISHFLNNLVDNSKISQFDLNQGLDWHKFQQAKVLPAPILNLKDSLIVPVPLSKRRRRWRGFNQAEILAKFIADNYDLDLSCGELVRIKHKKPQAKLDKTARQENIVDCFTWCGNDLAKRNIILIDDVVTTGATLNECAKILKASGAGEVWGLVIAKG